MERRWKAAAIVCLRYYPDGLRAGLPVRRSSLLHSAQIGSGGHPASCPVSTVSSLPGVKQPGRQADHSLPSNAEVKNGVAMLLLPNTSSCSGA
jgi:hypothetical protein